MGERNKKFIVMIIVVFCICIITAFIQTNQRQQSTSNQNTVSSTTSDNTTTRSTATTTSTTPPEPEVTDPNEIVSNYYKDRIIKVIPFEENGLKYIAVFHRNTVNSSPVYDHCSLLEKSDNAYKEVWKIDACSDNELTENQFVVKDIDGDGHYEVCYAVLSYGSGSGSGTVGAYTVTTNKEYTLGVDAYEITGQSDNSKSNPKIINYLTDRANEMKDKIYKDYNVAVVEAEKNNPQQLSIDELCKSPSEYYKQYAQLSGNIIFIKEDNKQGYDEGTMLVQSSRGNTIEVTYLCKTKNVMGDHVTVKAQIWGTASDFTSNGYPVPTVAAYYVSNSIDSTASASEYILPGSDSKYLADSDVYSLSKDQLALARNEIFARHGYVFQTSTYRDYFNSKSWYKPNSSYINNVDTLNEYEKYNLNLIQKYENI